MRPIRFVIALALVLAWALPAAALMVDVPMDQMVATSSDIVRGKIVALNSHWTDDHSIIVTDVSFQVSEAWMGTTAVGSKLSLQVNGGEVGDVGMRQENQPVFIQDQDAVLFLTATPSARLTINNAEQGVYRVLGQSVVGAKGVAIPMTAFHATINRMKSLRQR